jgi:predicted adenine nucleotide alpha hydrolase (AANH) superfamily ATPase
MGHDVRGYFRNPNIHPYREFRHRLDTFTDYCAMVAYDAFVDDSYGLREFLQEVGPEGRDRCAKCYRMRLMPAAAMAAREGFDAFTTTLLISPYQDHELVREVGEEAARDNGVAFAYFDFRPGFRESIKMSVDMGLYRQPYCGCVFSEEERYNRKSSAYRS